MPDGQRCGVIVWEAKNAQNWNNSGLPKSMETLKRVVLI